MGLVVTHPLVNILRGALSILVAIVSHPQSVSSQTSQPDAFGSRALKPAMSEHPQFLEMLVSRLDSADHALCAYALQLINSLMRDAITNDAETEWPKFINKLQDLGMIKAVLNLMQDTSLQDVAHPLLEFQGLTKIFLKKWRDIPVNLEKPDHRRALKSLHAASNPEKRPEQPQEDGEEGTKKKHNPQKWRRLGFETESPAWEFEDTGFLGMMDLTDYVRNNEDTYQKMLLEQSTKPMEQRCPIAGASLAVTTILYEHFEVDTSDTEDTRLYLALESKGGADKVFKPLILQWSRLHTAGLEAFFRLWKATGALQEDYNKMFELVRVLVEAVIGGAARTKSIETIEQETIEFELQRLRELQMELLELSYEDTWGPQVRQIKDELNREAVQFVKEQRIRCLLQGAWFPRGLGYKSQKTAITSQDLQPTAPSSYRYIRLSHNRRFLHYASFETQKDLEPETAALTEKSTSLPHQKVIAKLTNPVDLSIISSVSSNVSAPSETSSTQSTHSLPTSSTTITIYGFLPPVPTSPTSPTTSSTHNLDPKTESILLTLHPQSHTLASEWLDGLLMLLNQQPITAETNKLIKTVSEYGYKIRLLNVKLDAGRGEAPEVPSREGLDEEYYYDVAGGG